MISSTKFVLSWIKGKIKQHERQKYLTVDDYVQYKVLGRIKKIDIEEVDNSKILIATDDILPNNISLKRWLY